jgi:hypothetical protein
MNGLLTAATLAEALTGAALLVFPAIVVKLLFGVEIAGASVVISRFAGISLIALGVACWPGGAQGRGLPAMLTYSALATLYLAYLGLAREFVGILLWPAVVLHAGLTAVLAVAGFKRGSETRSDSAA